MATTSNSWGHHYTFYPKKRTSLQFRVSAGAQVIKPDLAINHVQLNAGKESGRQYKTSGESTAKNSRGVPDVPDASKTKTPLAHLKKEMKIKRKGYTNM